MSMADNMWAFELEDKLFSYVKHKSLNLVIGNKGGKDITLKTLYPNIKFTSSNLPNDKSIQYPTVYIHGLPAVEFGKDLRGTTVNAVLYTMQVDVVTDVSQSEARRVMSVIACIFKSIGFEIKEFPNFDNGTTYYRDVMRVSRVIGQYDFSEGISSLE